MSAPRPTWRRVPGEDDCWYRPARTGSVQVALVEQAGSQAWTATVAECSPSLASPAALERSLCLDVPRGPSGSRVATLADRVGGRVGAQGDLDGALAAALVRSGLAPGTAQTHTSRASALESVGIAERSRPHDPRVVVSFPWGKERTVVVRAIGMRWALAASGPDESPSVDAWPVDGTPPRAVGAPVRVAEPAQGLPCGQVRWAAGTDPDLVRAVQESPACLTSGAVRDRSGTLRTLTVHPGSMARSRAAGPGALPEAAHGAPARGRGRTETERRADERSA